MSTLRKRHPLFNVWRNMVKRCHNTAHPQYPEYGGRGITVCERWRMSFTHFVTDMGERPEGTTIDRFPNNDGNYELGNCRWASRWQQARNTRKNRLITFAGERLCLTEWATRLGVDHKTLAGRIDRHGEQRAIEMGAARKRGRRVWRDAA